MNGNEWTGHGEEREYAVFGYTENAIQSESENVYWGIMRNQNKKIKTRL